MIAHKVILEDTTLRDGEQTPGLAFSIDQKLAIFDALVKIGVRYIEPGIPSMGGDEVTALKTMLERKDEALLIAWNRGVRADIEASLALGFQAIHIGLPADASGEQSRPRPDLAFQASDGADQVRQGSWRIRLDQCGRRR